MKKLQKRIQLDSLCNNFCDFESD